MSELLHDVRFALRALRRAPGFTTAAVLTLALGIGATTGIFRLVNAVLLRSLPYEAPGRLVRIYGNAFGTKTGNVSPMDAMDWRAQAGLLDGIALISSSRLALTGRGEPELVTTGVASANIFDVLGVRPMLGRTFRPDEEVPGNHRVAMLAYDMWRGQFGADSDVVGRSITLGGDPYEIVGVLPPAFRDPRGGTSPELWRPLALTLTPEARGGHWLQAIARLAPGATVERAQVEMDAIMTRLEAQYPATNTDVRARLVPLHDALSADVRGPLLILLGAVGLLLIIACVNVANLVLVRAGTRGRELGVRTALGAGRGALVRQLLVEHAVLALAGGALGLALAQALGRGLVALGGGLMPQLTRARTDLTVVLFTLGISALTVLAFGVLPALRAARVDVRAALLEGGRGSTAGRAARRARGTLAGVQLALSFVLMAGAGLLVKSFARLDAVDTGFSREGVLTFGIALPRNGYANDSTVQSFHAALLERLQALPAVRAAGLVNMLPLSGSYSCDSFGLGDRPAPPEGREPCAEDRVATPGYFAAMGIPIVRGRGLDDRDREAAPKVVVINQEMARQYWPNGDPLGRRFSWGSAHEADWRTIVGIVGDVRHFGLDQPVQPAVYVPAAQAAQRGVTYAVRTTGDPRTLSPAIRAIVRDLDADLPLRNVRTMADLVSASVAAPRLRTVLLVAFAVLALLLAAVGVYGVLAYGVAQRTNEIGVRVAVGAGERQVLALVLRQGLAVSVVAVAVGAVATLWITPALKNLLFEVSPSDPVVLGGVAAFLLAVATLAGYVPARRATRIDPVEALRRE